MSLNPSMVNMPQLQALQNMQGMSGLQGIQGVPQGMAGMQGMQGMPFQQAQFPSGMMPSMNGKDNQKLMEAMMQKSQAQNGSTSTGQQQFAGMSGMNPMMMGGMGMLTP